MRIGIMAPGSRGDVEPYVAPGKGLAAAVHTVRLVTHENFEPLVRAHGLQFWPVDGSVQEIVEGAGMRERLEGGNLLAVLSEMSREAQRKLTAERLARAVETAVGDPGMRRRAADLGAKIRAEDGVAQAVAVVAGLPQRPRRC
jgi:UDP:flavonoid glycosyltransferase YjiC (YdhE family)